MNKEVLAKPQDSESNREENHKIWTEGEFKHLYVKRHPN